MVTFGENNVVLNLAWFSRGPRETHETPERREWGAISLAGDHQPRKALPILRFPESQENTVIYCIFLFQMKRTLWDGEDIEDCLEWGWWGRHSKCQVPLKRGFTHPHQGTSEYSIDCQSSWVSASRQWSSNCPPSMDPSRLRSSRFLLLFNALLSRVGDLSQPSMKKTQIPAGLPNSTSPPCHAIFPGCGIPRGARGENAELVSIYQQVISTRRIRCQFILLSKWYSLYSWCRTNMSYTICCTRRIFRIRVCIHPLRHVELSEFQFRFSQHKT